MPETNGHGFSDYTESKQLCFAAILETHLAISAAISARHPYISEYYFYDLTAGCGHNPENPKERGSPVIVFNALVEWKQKHPQFFVREEMFERVSTSFESLCVDIGMKADNCLLCGEGCRIACYKNGIIATARNHDFRCLTKIVNTNPHVNGILYHDSTGEVPPVNFFTELSGYNSVKRIDFLIYLSATNLKRVRMACCGFSLTAMMSKINKKFWLVREPEGPHQWTFLFGTNWSGFPEYKKHRFYSIELERGKDILHYLNYTKKELEAMNGQQCFID